MVRTKRVKWSFSGRKVIKWCLWFYSICSASWWYVLAHGVVHLTWCYHMPTFIRDEKKSVCIIQIVQLHCSNMLAPGFGISHARNSNTSCMVVIMVIFFFTVANIAAGYMEAKMLLFFLRNRKRLTVKLHALCQWCKNVCMHYLHMASRTPPISILPAQSMARFPFWCAVAIVLILISFCYTISKDTYITHIRSHSNVPSRFTFPIQNHTTVGVAIGFLSHNMEM